MGMQYVSNTLEIVSKFSSINLQGKAYYMEDNIKVYI